VSIDTERLIRHLLRRMNAEGPTLGPVPAPPERPASRPPAGCDPAGPPARPAAAGGSEGSNQRRRIMWPAEEPAASPKPPTPPVAKTPAKVSWGDAAGGTKPGHELSLLVGVDDAFEHTPLMAGEQVALCTYDKVAYHLRTWEFLRKENQGRCCSCGRSGTIRIVTLPGVRVSAPPPVSAPDPSLLSPGETVISLSRIRDFEGRAVVVHDFVQEVHFSQRGTCFIKFEDRPIPEAFKVVVFDSYQVEWEEAEVDLKSYQHRYIRVRGVIQDHWKWGWEILVNSPRLIQVAEGPLGK
jgi:hypothetical protein